MQGGGRGREEVCAACRLWRLPGHRTTKHTNTRIILTARCPGQGRGGEAGEFPEQDKARQENSRGEARTKRAQHMAQSSHPGTPGSTGSNRQQQQRGTKRAPGGTVLSPRADGRPRSAKAPARPPQVTAKVLLPPSSVPTPPRPAGVLQVRLTWCRRRERPCWGGGSALSWPPEPVPSSRRQRPAQSCLP